MDQRVPPYFDYLIAGFRRGEVGRFVHLGYWDRRPPMEVRSAGEFAAAQQRLNDILLKMAGLRDGLSVLDVGCGFGGTLAEVNRSFHDMRLVGINVDSRQLGICGELKPLHQNELYWLEGDAGELPLDDASVDCVLCIEAMFHFQSRRRFFREVARVLRSDGVLVFSDILLSTAARLDERPEFVDEAALCEGFGPWPDPWGEDADHRELGTVAGLGCVSEIDATVNTAPSHQFTTPTRIDAQLDPGDTVLRAALTLRWLHEHGQLKYVLFKFTKPAA